MVGCGSGSIYWVEFAIKEVEVDRVEFSFDDDVLDVVVIDCKLVDDDDGVVDVLVVVVVVKVDLVVVVSCSNKK